MRWRAVGLAVVRDLRPDLRLTSSEAVEAFEQDLLAEFVLARSSAGIVTPQPATSWSPRSTRSTGRAVMSCSG